MGSNAYPANVRHNRLQTSSHRCPLGYAPTISSGDCMYCEHPLLSTCHADYGRDPDGNVITSAHPAPERVTLRYSEQSTLYVRGHWVDLRAVRDILDEEIFKRDAMQPSDVWTVVEDVARILPEGYGLYGKNAVIADPEGGVGIVIDETGLSADDIEAARILGVTVGSWS